MRLRVVELLDECDRCVSLLYQADVLCTRATRIGPASCKRASEAALRAYGVTVVRALDGTRYTRNGQPVNVTFEMHMVRE